jgi:hypothetical protein
MRPTFFKRENTIIKSFKIEERESIKMSKAKGRVSAGLEIIIEMRQSIKKLKILNIY